MVAQRIDHHEEGLIPREQDHFLSQYSFESKKKNEAKEICMIAWNHVEMIDPITLPHAKFANAALWWGTIRQVFLRYCAIP